MTFKFISINGNLCMHAQTGVTLNAPPPFFDGRGHKNRNIRALYCGPCRETNRFAIRQSNTQIDLRTFAT